MKGGKNLSYKGISNNEMRRKKEELIMRRKKLLYVAICMALICCSFSCFAGYQELMSVKKDGLAEVYSLGTSTIIYSCAYGGTCSSGTLHVTAQYFDPSLSAYRSSPATLVLSSKTTDSSTAYIDGAQIWRVHLHGLTGRGEGWIQGK